MNAIRAAAEPATPATPAIWLCFDVIDARCEELGAETEGARAALLEVDRATLWRWRQRHIGVSLARALSIATALGLPVEQIVERPS